jgi:hypothetical protein
MLCCGDELAFGFANDEKGTGRVADNLFGGAAQDHAAKALATMSRDDDKVNAEIFSSVGDFRVGPNERI